MALDPDAARRTIVEAEFRALQAMCQAAPQDAVREHAFTVLAGYRFRDPLHQLLFDILRELRTQPADQLRTLLPQRLTIKGFPDLDIEPFFHRHAMSVELACAIVDYLHASSRLDLRPAPGRTTG